MWVEYVTVQVSTSDQLQYQVCIHMVFILRDSK